MKLSGIILLIALAFVAVLLPYIFTFSLPLSLRSQDWANFGSYIGGTLSPLIATLGVLGLGITIYQQGKQLDSFSKQLNLTQLENTIRSIENDFISCLNSRTFEFEGQLYTYEDLLMDLAISSAEKSIPAKASLEENRSKLTANEIIFIGIIGAAAGHLNQLRIYVNQHYELSGNNIISKYYERKYKNAHDKLIRLDYLDGDKGWIRA
tara:strand:+ start:64 stop:687 length:624 start_codon:yes stop_codon:yes gene_type:complete